MSLDSLMSVIFVSEDVVDIKNIITILIIIAVVFDSFTRFCEHTPRVS